MAMFSPGASKASCNTNGLIGPYSYKGWGPGSNCNPCPPACCDVDFTFDYGTTQNLSLDWTNILQQHGECKVVTSQWYLQDTAADPLTFGNQKIETNVTSLMVGGGMLAGEYKLVNHITTEEGTSHRLIVLCQGGWLSYRRSYLCW